MIQRDGYYLSEPLEIVMTRAKGESTYLFGAFYFEKPGYVFLSTKFLRVNEVSDFTKEDFIISDRKALAETSGDIILIKDLDQQEGGAKYKIESPDEFVSLENGSRLYYVGWSKADEMKNAGLSVINELFAPFESSKYNQYFE